MLQSAVRPFVTTEATTVHIPLAPLVPQVPVHMATCSQRIAPIREDTLYITPQQHFNLIVREPCRLIIAVFAMHTAVRVIPN